MKALRAQFHLSVILLELPPLCAYFILRLIARWLQLFKPSQTDMKRKKDHFFLSPKSKETFPRSPPGYSVMSLSRTGSHAHAPPVLAKELGLP